jgi:hypothetical protein
MFIHEKDAVFLEHAKKYGWVFDINAGIIYRKNKPIGSCNKRSYTVFFKHENKLYGIARARAIWLSIYGSIGPGLQVSHKSSNLQDDSISNLELLTNSEICKKTVSVHGYIKPPDSCKLEKDAIIDARKSVRAGAFISAMAKKYNVSKPTMLFAVRGITHKDIDVFEPPVPPPLEKVKKEKVKRIRKSRTKIVKPPKIKMGVNDDIARLATSFLKNNNNLSTQSVYNFLAKLNKVDDCSLAQLDNWRKKVTFNK